MRLVSFSTLGGDGSWACFSCPYPKKGIVSQKCSWSMLRRPATFAIQFKHKFQAPLLEEPVVTSCVLELLFSPPGRLWPMPPENASAAVTATLYPRPHLVTKNTQQKPCIKTTMYRPPPPLPAARTPPSQPPSLLPPTTLTAPNPPVNIPKKKLGTIQKKIRSCHTTRAPATRRARSCRS